MVIFQVDGLIRLMEGGHTGPINIGNPGKDICFILSSLLIYDTPLPDRFLSFR